MSACEHLCWKDKHDLSAYVTDVFILYRLIHCVAVLKWRRKHNCESLSAGPQQSILKLHITFHVCCGMHNTVGFYVHVFKIISLFIWTQVHFYFGVLYSINQKFKKNISGRASVHNVFPLVCSNWQTAVESWCGLKEDKYFLTGGIIDGC